MQNAYVVLGLSIIFEVFGTTMLKLSDSFTNLLPSIGVIAGFAVAFYGLSKALKTIPLSFAYALWSGAGTAFTAIIGILVWNDPFTILTFSGLVLIIGGIALLNAPAHSPSPKRWLYRHLYRSEN